MVSGSLSSTEGSGQIQTAPLNTYTKTFEDLFPYYLSIGMTEEQYWDRDCNLVKSYRKADEMAAANKQTSLSSVWLMNMPAERAATIQRKMANKPETLD